MVVVTEFVLEPLATTIAATAPPTTAAATIGSSRK
jgi:hypothetical protein